MSSFRRGFQAVAIGIGVLFPALAGPSLAQTQRDIDILVSVTRRTAAAERASMDPIVLASETGDVQSLINLFRSSSDPAFRERAAGAMLKIGGNAPARLIAALHTEYKTKVRRYRGAFQDEVAALVKRKRDGASAADIALLQQQVTDLARDPGLTKDRIAKEGDPAMKRLAELLSIDRKTVLALSPGLQASRKELLELVSLAARAARQLPTSERRLGEKLPPAAQLDLELTESEELAALMVTPMKPEAQDVMFENVALSKELDPEEAAGVLMLNLMRIRVGLQPLAIDLKLADASRGHSKDMRTLGFFSHTSPISGKTTPWDRARLAGSSASGENIFYGSAAHNAAIMAWWYSPGHHKNMMNPSFRRIGLGRIDGHWTQLFGS